MTEKAKKGIIKVVVNYNIKAHFQEIFMEQLMEILKQMHPDVDFSSETDLIGDEILDSLDIVTLITEINSTFDISIPAEEILPENFASAEAIYALITRLDEE